MNSAKTNGADTAIAVNVLNTGKIASCLSR
jgi:hypothetical protein